MATLFDLFFPKFCVGCGKLGSYFCDSCQKNIFQKDLFCPYCEKASIGGLTHPLCHKKSGLDGLWSLGVYQNPLRKLIQKLKYKWVSEVGEVLVDIILDYWVRFNPYLLDEIKKDQGVGWVIIPVPLHRFRENYRGYNQSGVIGKLLAEKLGLKYQDLLIRSKNTKSQVGLDIYQRRKNIKNVFSLATKSYLPASKILLIDDVWTTGATLKECCYVLKRAGAKKVWAITIAC